MTEAAFKPRAWWRDQRGFLDLGSGLPASSEPNPELDVVPPGTQTDVEVHATGTDAENGTALQSAITAAADNTRILLDKDGVYEGHFTIDGKTNLWIETVGLDTDPDFPDLVTPVTPANGTRLATIQMNGYGENGVCLSVIPGCTGIRLRGLQFAFVTGSIPGGASTNWIVMGSNDQVVGDIPLNCHLDRVMCHLSSYVYNDNVQNFVLWCSGSSSIRRCYFEGALTDGIETHCINIDRVQGNVNVFDNYIGTASIGVLVGGGGPPFGTSFDTYPSGFYFRRNHFRKDPAYNPALGDGNGFSMSTIYLKGGLEFKFGNGIIVEGNFFETIYSAGDVNVAAVSFSTKVNEAYSGSRYATADDSYIRYNYFFNCTTIAEVTVGSDASVAPATSDFRATSGVYIGHNVIFGLTYDAPLGVSNAMGHAFFINGVKNCTVEHNTIHATGTTGAGGMFYLDNVGYPAGLGGTPNLDLTGLVIRNNHFGTFTTYSMQPEYDVTALLAAVSGDASVLKNYAVDDAYATNWPGGTAAMAAANAGAFWTDFTTEPTDNADASLLTLGNWTPQATLAGYGTATGSTGYAHPCANWSLITAAMGRLYSELA